MNQARIMDCNCHEPGTITERNGHTASCNRARRKEEERERRTKVVTREIRKVSPKMAAAISIYTKKKKKWIKGKMCAVFPTLKAIEPHHMKGKSNIELLLDERYWLPVSREGHNKIEQNPIWAKEQGFSLSRLAKEQ